MSNDDIELIKALAALIEAQLLLKKDHFVIYNQKFDIPPDDELRGWIAFQRGKPFGSSLNYVNVPAVGDQPARLDEVQSLNQQETYTINLYSRDGSARQRNHEIVFALHSTQCQQLQERYSFRMGYIPSSMIDISAIEGAARLNRYSLTFSLLRAYTRTRQIEFFDTFSTTFSTGVSTTTSELIIEP